MKIVIIGGHLTPALAVIEKLPKDAEILYIGRKYAIEGDSAVSLEYETITKKRIPFALLKTGRLQRSFTLRTIPSLAKIPYGFSQSLLILGKFRPEVVVGFGGYVSLPVILAAKVLKIPIVIHEQTLEAGAANQFLSRFADKVCISFETSGKSFPKEKTILTGNPVRNTILHPTKKFDFPAGEMIFVTGGSIGAHFINTLIKECLTKLLDNFVIVHQTGDSHEFKDFEKLSILKEGLNNNKREKYILAKFFSPSEIGAVLRNASLVVSRAGINTVSELVVLEKPAYLVPIPFSQRDEQLKNAMFIKQLGLGEVGGQKSLTPDVFFDQIIKMMGKIESYKIKKIKHEFPKDAAEKIVEIIYAAGKNNN